MKHFLFLLFFYDYNIKSINKTPQNLVNSLNDILKKNVEISSEISVNSFYLEEIKNKFDNLIRSLSKDNLMLIFNFISNLKIKDKKDFELNFLEQIYLCAQNDDLNEFKKIFLQMISHFFVKDLDINYEQNNVILNFFHSILKDILKAFINKQMNSKDLYTLTKKSTTLLSKQQQIRQNIKNKINTLKDSNNIIKNKMMQIIKEYTNENNLSQDLFEYIKFQNMQYYLSHNISLDFNENNAPLKEIDFYNQYSNLKNKFNNNINIFENNYQKFLNFLPYEQKLNFVRLDELDKIFYEELNYYYEKFKKQNILCNELEDILENTLKLQNDFQKNNFNEIIFSLIKIFNTFLKNKDTESYVFIKGQNELINHEKKQSEVNTHTLFNHHNDKKKGLVYHFQEATQTVKKKQKTTSLKKKKKIIILSTGTFIVFLSVFLYQNNFFN